MWKLVDRTGKEKKNQQTCLRREKKIHSPRKLLDMRRHISFHGTRVSEEDRGREARKDVQRNKD